MDWKSGLVTFAIIFFAELGDKTQLMIMSLSASAKSPQQVFFGAAAGLIASSLLAVLAGEYLLRAVPLWMVRFGTGVAFLGIGALLVVKSLR